jgi:hypothetical protein
VHINNFVSVRAVVIHARASFRAIDYQPNVAFILSLKKDQRNILNKIQSKIDEAIAFLVGKLYESPMLDKSSVARINNFLKEIEPIEQRMTQIVELGDPALSREYADLAKKLRDKFNDLVSVVSLYYGEVF